MEDATCLRESFQKAENLRVAVEDHFNYSEESYTKALELYHQSQVLVQQLAIFSENETLDDISTTDLQCVTSS